MSLEEVSKSSKVMIHRACRVIMSSPEATSHIGGAVARRDPPATHLPGVIFAVDVVP